MKLGNPTLYFQELKDVRHPLFQFIYSYNIYQSEDQERKKNLDYNNIDTVTLCYIITCPFNIFYF